MIITLTPDIEAVLTQQAQAQGKTPEHLVLERLRAEFAPAPDKREQQVRPFDPQDEWERRLQQASSPAGVALSPEAVSSEGIY